MLETLREMIERYSRELRALDDELRAFVYEEAVFAAERSGGYVEHPGEPEYMSRVPECVWRQDMDGRWYFPMLRRRARELAKHQRHNQKRRQATKRSSNDGSAQESCTHDSCSSVLKTNTVSTPLRPAGACARNSNILCEPESDSRQTTEQSYDDGFDDAITLFEDFDKPPEKRKRATRIQPWHPVYDAIVEVTHADTRKSTRAHVAKVARDLHDCDPPYTADDVRRLPEILSRQPWWTMGMNVSIAIVQKHIGLVRAVREVQDSAKEEPIKTLADYREAAIRAWREQCRGS